MATIERNRQRLASDYPGLRTTLRLDATRVPQKLQEFLPYAEIWGLSDDIDRDELVRATPKAARDEIISIVSRHDNDFDDWLAGPEANRPPSDEYRAFTCLRMAAGLAAQLNRRTLT